MWGVFLFAEDKIAMTLELMVQEKNFAKAGPADEPQRSRDKREGTGID